VAAYQRLAWVQLAICVAAAAAVVLMGVNFGWRGAFAGFGLLGLCGLLPLLTRPGRSNGVVGDERDAAIQVRALRTAFAVIWLSLVLGWGFVWWTGGTNASVPVVDITCFLIVLFFLLLFSYSLTAVIAYRTSGPQ